ncbi:MAG: squalene--hopene cyclase [Pseudomonadota bacterium]
MAVQDTGFIGIVCGLESERRALGADILVNPAFRVAVSGARPDAACRMASELASSGARLLLSWGLCGALDAGRPPGTMIIAETVVGADGRTRKLEPLSELAATLGATTVPRLFGSDTVIGTPHEKAALRVSSGASAVDMETHRVADAAEAAGIPAAAVRSVSDPSDRALPALADGAVDTKGRPKILSVLWGLAKRPFDLPDLIAAGRDANAAHGALSAAAAPVTAYLERYLR